MTFTQMELGISRFRDALFKNFTDKRDKKSSNLVNVIFGCPLIHLAKMQRRNQLCFLAKGPNYIESLCISGQGQNRTLKLYTNWRLASVVLWYILLLASQKIAADQRWNLF